MAVQFSEDQALKPGTDRPTSILRCLYGETAPTITCEFAYQENVALKEAALKHPQADLFQPDYPERTNSYPNDLDDVLISQWLTFAQTFTKHEVQTFDQSMESQVFLIGKKVTLADAAVYIAFLSVARETGLKGLPHLRRWFDFVQHLFHPRSGQELVVFDSPPTLVKIGTARSSSGAGAVDAGNGKDSKKQGAAPATATATAAAPAAATPASATAAPAAAGKEGALPPQPPKEGKGKKEGKKDGKKEGGDAAPPAAAAAAGGGGGDKDDDLDPSKLEIRVGHVVKCWDHPESDKLLCEEIDLGEGSVRSIASGLRPHYTAAQLEGRKVLVLANLKPRAIAGFTSNGMVLCASNADHTVVKLLEPPASAAPGERVEFAGFSSEAATPAQMAKKKILEKLAPQLKTDAEGRAKWGEAAFFTLKDGQVNADTLLPNASIS